MCRVTLVGICTLLTFSAADHGYAQSLRASPVTIDVPVAAQSSAINVSNDSDKPMKVQARVFRWSQKDGQDVLERTSDVVVSPPILSVAKGSDGIVRVARVSPKPVEGEETYRIILDEVPSREKLQGGGLAVVVRQSLPVFFAGLDAKPSTLSWSAERTKDKLILKAVNNGQKRARLSKMKVTDDKKEVAKIEGLAGYVLGGQSRSWEISVTPGLSNSGTEINIQATVNSGPINATAVVGKGG